MTLWPRPQAIWKLMDQCEAKRRVELGGWGSNILHSRVQTKEETIRLDHVPTPNKIFIIWLSLSESGRKVELGNSEIAHNRVQTISRNLRYRISRHIPGEIFFTRSRSQPEKNLILWGSHRFSYFYFFRCAQIHFLIFLYIFRHIRSSWSLYLSFCFPALRIIFIVFVNNSLVSYVSNMYRVSNTLTVQYTLRHRG